MAFVIPWYGENIPGGAERLCRQTAKQLKARGVDVEILTTCIKDFFHNWGKNFHRGGETREGGLTVRRFSVSERNSKRFDEINAKLLKISSSRSDLARMEKRERDSISECFYPLTQDEERLYFSEMIKCPDLLKYIEAHQDDYDYFIFIPYMFSTTVFGAMICPEKSILIPCLHNESQAYLRIFTEIFSSVKGVIFNIPAEYRLTCSLFGKQSSSWQVLGAGVDTDVVYDEDRFRKKYGIQGQFLLYAGKKDPMKNVPLLINWFRHFKQRNPEEDISLVLIGPGLECKEPESGILDLGFLPQQEIYDAYGASTVLCQPSVNESFSLVIMEAWLCGTPVLVHEHCEGLVDHCQTSNGGLYFADYEEFEECLHFFLKNPKIGTRMASGGRSYVLENFTWDKVIRRYKDLFHSLQ